MYRRKAASRGIQFELTEEEFFALTSSDCFYCGEKPSRTNKASDRYGHYVYNGVDRVDNSVGYATANCVPCCANCNYKKSAVTRQIIEKAYEFLSADK